MKGKENHKEQDILHDEMGTKPPHISDDEIRRLITEARRQEGIDGLQSKKDALRRVEL